MKTSKFKVGDTVTRPDGICRGMIFEVVSIDDGFVTVKKKSSNFTSSRYFPRSLSLVQEPNDIMKELCSKYATE